MIWVRLPQSISGAKWANDSILKAYHRIKIADDLTFYSGERSSAANNRHISVKTVKLRCEIRIKQRANYKQIVFCLAV